MKDRVQLDTAGKKIGRVVKYTALAPLLGVALVVGAPVWIAMATEGECGGIPGAEENIASGTRFYAAVSRNVQLAPVAVFPKYDTPEDVPKPPIQELPPR